MKNQKESKRKESKQKENLSTEKKWLTRQEVQDMFNVSISCVYSWINKGIITRHRLGNKIYFDIEEINQTLKDSAA